MRAHFGLPSVRGGGFAIVSTSEGNALTGWIKSKRLTSEHQSRCGLRFRTLRYLVSKSATSRLSKRAVTKPCLG